MSNGTSQGLFIIIAVVIFGIFTLISYLLFNDSLKPKLTSIFDKSFYDLGSIGKKNLIECVKYSTGNNISVLDDNKGQVTLRKKLYLTENINERNHFLYMAKQPLYKAGDTYRFEIDLFYETYEINKDFTGVFQPNASVNIRYINEGKHILVEEMIVSSDVLGKWKKYSAEITLPEGLDFENLTVQGSVSLHSQELITLKTKNAKLYLL